jgi:hypothetical protein
VIFLPLCARPASPPLGRDRLQCGKKKFTRS